MASHFSRHTVCTAKLAVRMDTKAKLAERYFIYHHKVQNFNHGPEKHTFHN